MPQIIPAVRSDIPGLCNLLAELFSLEQEFAPDLMLQAEALTLLIDAPQRGTVWVAREGEQLVGMVSLQYLFSTALGGPVAILEDMVVAASHRGQGLGRRLIEQAVAHARAQGCRRITLLTDRENLAAQRFYANAGFSISTMVPMRQVFTTG
jgi:GNAT superfamily N-acetyltransferase